MTRGHRRPTATGRRFNDQRLEEVGAPDPEGSRLLTEAVRYRWMVPARGKVWKVA